MPLPGVGVFGGSGHKPVLEIKPDSTFVVFYGAPSESQVAELTGKLVLTNYEAMNVRSIKLGLLGMRRTSWSTTNTITPQPILTKLGFHRDDKSLFPSDGSKNKPHKINPGVHEWNFCFKMPSYLDESVEGIDTNWIVYNLNATVDRGYLTKQLTATKHIRVVRTLGRDMLETQPMEQINEDIWASKLAYKITVPQKNYIIGTSITAHFVLIPLRKGVEISSIRMDLIESRVLYSEYAGRRISHSDDRIIVQKEGPLPPNSLQEVPEDDENADHLFDEAHRFQMTLDLPKSLRKCRQSVDTEYLRITHKLRIYVNLHNPEGHTSQLLVKNHIHLFISPNLPPNEDQSVSVDQGILTSQQMREEALQNAPPTYGQHQLDELYNDIDPSGFITPGGRGTSGANTPFYGHSRQGSIEDLAALGNIVHQTDGGASITALHSRLNNLNVSDNRSPWQNSSGGSTPGGYFAGVEHYDMEALIRTPSYNTAVRTPARTPTGDLPTYEVATSRPSSPSHTPRSGHTSPSPTRSLDTLAEETERNTELNSRRTSPSRSSQRSDDQSLRAASISTTISTTSTSSTHSRSSSSGIVGRKLLFASKPTIHPRTWSSPSSPTLPKPASLPQPPTLTITPPPSPPDSDSDHHNYPPPSDPDHYDYPPNHPSASMSKRDTLSSISILRSALRGSRSNSQ